MLPVMTDTRQAEAARQAVITYNAMAGRVNADEITNEELIAELHAIAALAMVAGDPDLERAADAMWEATREGDLAWAGYAPRFIRAASRLVPEHRRVSAVAIKES